MRFSIKVMVCMLGIVLVLSRWIALHLEGNASDVPWYARYAREHGEASRQGLGFYDFHIREIQSERDKASVKGIEGPPQEYQWVEYPPLAIVLMQLPCYWMGPADAGDYPPETFTAAYVRAYRLGMAAVDAVLLLLVVVLVGRLYPDESVVERMARLCAYVLGTALLLPFLYDRLDLLQTLFMVVAFALLILKVHFCWSFVCLALAVHLKLVPIVLAPIFVLGSLPLSAGRLLQPRTLSMLATRGILLTVLIAGGFVLFLGLAGPHALDFLSYHHSRGIEVESLWGSLLLALKALGLQVDLVFSHCSVNVRSALSPGMIGFSTPLFALLFVLLTIQLMVHLGRQTQGITGAVRPRITLGQALPQTFAAYSLLMLMLFIATNKVFSPQYLLWLGPFVALAPFPRKIQWLFQGSFLLTCLLSSFVLVVLGTDVVSPGAEPYTWTVHGLTTRLTPLLILGSCRSIPITIHPTNRFTLRRSPDDAGQQIKGQRRPCAGCHAHAVASVPGGRPFLPGTATPRRTHAALRPLPVALLLPSF